MAIQNLLLQSQTFTNATNWTQRNLTPTTGQTAPDGTSTAIQFLETTTNAQHDSTQGGVATRASSTAALILSLYVKPVGGRDFKMFIYDSAIVAPAVRAAEPSAASTGAGSSVAEWRAAISTRGFDARDFKLSKFNDAENILVWADYCVAASLGEPPLSDREKLRHDGVDLVVFPESHQDWSASLDQLAGLLRG